MGKADTDEAEEATTPDEVEDEKESGHSGLTLDGLADKVDALADRVSAALTGRPRTGTRADESEEVASQVREEVKKIKADDDRQAKANDRIGKVEAAVKKIVERAPVEYRAITKMMWGDPDE